MVRATNDSTTPAFLRAAAHPIRWRLLGELARSDRLVHELTALVGAPQNLVSYHLGQLRRAHVVTARRSSADRRDTYYHLDMARCAVMMSDAGAALHPGLRLVPPAVRPAARGRQRVRVLFLCTGNSSRSQIAEALLRRDAGRAVVVRSAGSNPKPVHEYAVTAMAEHGIDLSRARSKHLERFIGDEFDYVISLCDRLREVCPEFPGHPRVVHWSIPDPAVDPEGYPAFQRVAADLVQRIRFLQHSLAHEEVP